MPLTETDGPAHDSSGGPRARRLAAFTAAAVLAGFGVAAVVHGVDGRHTARSTLAREDVVGLPYMTPVAIAKQARHAGLRDVALPSCSVAGKRIDDGASARCFAQYMRIDALMATHGATYAQMPRFATRDGHGTDDPARAERGPGGRPRDNPARTVWVTQTALSNALNTSYMAEQVSLFGIAVGAGFLLLALAFTAVALKGIRIPVRVRRSSRTRAAQPATP